MLLEEYRSLFPKCESFCLELERQLAEIVSSGDIALGFPIQYRVKSWDSIREKIQRLGREIVTVADLQDLIGFRLILLFRRDVDRVAGLLDTHLEIDKKYDTAHRLKDDQFGYTSLHFVVRIPKQWLSIPTLATFEKMVAEIQVRTVTQHIWAEVSHRLQYKRESSVPPTLRRALYRVSALLETIDLEFERLLTERSDYRDELPDKPADEKLNVDLLESILDRSFPEKNKEAFEDYAFLLEDLQHFDVVTKRQLEALISRYRDRAMAEERRIVGDRPPSHWPNESRFAQGVFFTHAGFMREVLSAEFGTRWIEYIRELSQQRLS